MTDSQLTFLGDVFLPQPFSVDLPYRRVVLNLEQPITRHAAAAPGKVNLRTTESHLFETFGTRAAAVCLANNHVSDFGDQGLRDTMDSLASDGLPYFGAGTVSDNCNNPLLLTVGEHVVALLGYACASTSPIAVSPGGMGVPLIGSDVVRADIDRARSLGADRVVVNFHWGAEEVSAAKRNDVLTARAAVDAGADLVIGHHAHCIQDIERYGDAYIFYGLGNCIFPDLEVGAMYDPASNAPSRMYRKKQKPWNRRSLAVTYVPRTNAVAVDRLKFNGERLAVERTLDVAKAAALTLGESYQRRYRRRFLYGRIRNTVFNFLYEPKMPGPRHLKSLWGMLNSSEYRRGG